jgi:hypothetical protein
LGNVFFPSKSFGQKNKPERTDFTHVHNSDQNLRRIIMSNLSGNGPTNEYSNRPLPTGRYSGSWIAAAVIAVIVVLGLGYFYENRSTDSSVEHRAAATDVPTPAALPTPVAPSAPAATPKP